MNTIDNKIINIFKMLMNAGADIEIADSYGNTPLIYACRYSTDKRIIDTLLDSGADEKALNDDDNSFYDVLDKNKKQYFLKKYPRKVYNSISHKYKKSYDDFLKEYGVN